MKVFGISLRVVVVIAVGWSLEVTHPEVATAESVSNTQVVRQANRRERANKTSGLNRFCPKGVRSIPFGVLWKPASDVVDQRRGKPALLFTGANKPKSSSVNIYSTNGKLLCSFGFKGSSIPGVNGGADHYFSGWGSGCGKTGSQISQSARAASQNGNVFISWKNGQCLGPVNPSGRTGGI